MQNCFFMGLVVKTAKSGYRWKVVVMGNADGHVMDWAGCNFKSVIVKGQPVDGYGTQEEANEYLNSLSPDFKASEIGRGGDSTGAWRRDVQGKEMTEFYSTTRA